MNEPLDLTAHERVKLGQGAQDFGVLNSQRHRETPQKRKRLTADKRDGAATRQASGSIDRAVVRSSEQQKSLSGRPRGTPLASTRRNAFSKVQKDRTKDILQNS